MTRITIFESVGNKSSCKEIGQLFRPFKAVTTSLAKFRDQLSYFLADCRKQLGYFLFNDLITLSKSQYCVIVDVFVARWLLLFYYERIAPFKYDLYFPFTF